MNHEQTLIPFLQVSLTLTKLTYKIINIFLYKLVSKLIIILKLGVFIIIYS